ncbi:MAG: GNAT family N-acetyltransferase [Phycisphaerae bacterium]|nr:GNAT family N-acetyltransferase [Phycisphaerae bacterium]
MSAPFPQFRTGNAADADALAELVNIAGDGMPLHLWAKSARPGQSAWEVGRERARLGLGGFAFQNTIVAEVDRRVAACLFGCPLAESPPPPDGPLPAMLAPLVELQRLVADSWYINILATFPAFRGRGLATALLGLAEARAADARCPRVSLILSNANAVARRLYEKCGFVEVGRRPIVTDGWEHSGTEWTLLAKAVTGGRPREAS